MCALLVSSITPLSAARAEAPSPHKASPATVAESGTRLVIAGAGWGDTDPARLESLLKTIAAEFDARIPGPAVGTVRVVPGPSNPMVLYQRGTEGEYIVRLSARDAHWYQFAYQFGHELCHIHSNYANKPHMGEQVVSDNQWFEESLCEAAALLTLEMLARRWEAGPADNPWTTYAPTLRRYAQLLKQAPHRRLPQHQTLARWYAERRDTLRGNPYLREQDEVVSNRLLALFEANPDSLAVIAYLNADRADAAKPFEDYLGAWCLACPERYRATVERILALFDLSPPSAG